MSADFAIYRLPFEKNCVLIEQEKGNRPLRLNSPKELAGVEGFVFAPFVVSKDCPLLVLQGERRESPPCTPLVGVRSARHYDEKSVSSPFDRVEADSGWERERRCYHHDFELFHAQLERGELEKVVLARHSFCEKREPVDALTLFYRACAMYPRLFVALVNMEACGTWLMATPEILLENENDCWHTMALAGTMAACDGKKWNQKNEREQAMVALYVRERLLPLADAIEETGPFTAEAGNLLHLRSDFRFRLKEGTDCGRLLSALHPTPAVCGLPKETACRFIEAHESGERRYYSGFCGEMSKESTHLYVSLRCMEIGADGLVFHAGGGLLRDSEEQQEWDETEIKMDTMRKLIESEK